MWDLIAGLSETDCSRIMKQRKTGADAWALCLPFVKRIDLQSGRDARNRPVDTVERVKPSSWDKNSGIVQVRLQL